MGNFSWRKYRIACLDMQIVNLLFILIGRRRPVRRRQPDGASCPSINARHKIIVEQQGHLSCQTSALLFL
jgi:hypothetical protein